MTAPELQDLLHPDVVFESPVVHTPQRGRDITFKYLASATRCSAVPPSPTSANGAATKARCWKFETEIDGITINGVDIIKFADDGRITHFKVMVRPLKAINLLHRLMGEQFGDAVRRLAPLSD